MLFFPFNSWCTFPWQNIAKKIQSTFFGQFFGKPHSKIYTQKERFHALNCPSNYLYFDLKTSYVLFSKIGRWLKKRQLKGNDIINCIFFTIFKKSSKKKENGLQLDSNSRSGCYKADTLTTKLLYKEVVKIVRYVK